MKISTEQRKEIIIQNFAGLIKQYGIERLTLNDVAEKSGLTKSALYYYFDSKEALIVSTYRYFRERTSAKLASMLKKAASPDEMLGKYCEFSFSVVPNDSDLRSVFEFSEDTMREVQKYVMTIPGLVREIQINREKDFERLSEIIAAHSGQDKNDPRIMKIAMSFSSMISGFMLVRFKIKKEKDIPGDSTAETKFSSELLSQLTLEEFTAFMTTGLDALIKQTFNK